MNRKMSRHTAVCAAALLALSVTASALAQSKGNPAQGEAKTTGCNSCHGTAAAAPKANSPALAGQQSEFLEMQMILMREGLRLVPEMRGWLSRYSDKDLTDIAAFYAAAKPLALKGARNEALFAKGATLAEAMGCGSCHMGDYTGQRQVPRIVNQREDYLGRALKAYRDNERSGSDTSMNAVMYKASDADIAALAHFLSQQ